MPRAARVLCVGLLSAVAIACPALRGRACADALPERAEAVVDYRISAASA
jgi:hypothetical protein